MATAEQLKPADHRQLTAVYEAGSVTVRILRALGWGPQLLNLGYFTWSGLFSPLNLLPNRHRLADSQMRLVRKAVRWLAPSSGEKVLDIACGRGWGAYFVAAAYPTCDVTAVDLLPENVAIAATLYAHTRNLQYVVGDALQLPFADGTFDKIMCIEAAFHFSDRPSFLHEAARVLKPGGCMVIVDFMWKKTDRATLLSRPETKIVQQTWGWQDFSAIDEYRQAISAAGLDLTVELDWTRKVTGALQWQFEAFAKLGASQLGRRLVVAVNDLLRGFSRADWRDLQKAAAAHRFVNKHSRYMTMVMRKPLTKSHIKVGGPA